MATARTKQRSQSAYAVSAAASAMETWGLPVAAGVIALLAAVATAVGFVQPPLGLAITIVSLLALGAERGLAKAAAATPGLVVALAIAAVWIAICYAPFHPLLFPGAPLHEPIVLHDADAALPVPVPTAGYTAVDLLLEGQLPPNPSGGTAIPVTYALTVNTGGASPQVVSGRFEERLATRRLGRRGSATVVQAHHAERRMLSNPGGGDVLVTGVSLEPSAGATITVTALAHHLPSTPVLIVLVLAVLAAVVAIDTRLIPGSDGVLTYLTPVAFGTALVLWTSNTVHPTVSSLIGATMFGGAPGLGVGALLWAVARRTLVDGRG